MGLFLLKVCVFLASYLIFQIELILGKVLLPGFGGGYLVWGVSVVLYQGLLFFGYAYVHWVNHMFQWARVRKTHIGLALLSLAFLPVRVGNLTDPSYKFPMVVEVVLMLLVTIGVLFFLLSTLSVYAQVQVSASDLSARDNPYVLYAASNLGAFASLFAYPFLWEPNFDLSDQLLYWEVGYGVVVLLFLAAQFKIPLRPMKAPLGTAMASVDKVKLIRWLLLSAAPSALFLAVTNELTFNLAPVPLLWIFPLSIYLFTLVLCFKKKPWCPLIFRNHFSLLISMGVLLFLFNMMGHSLLEFLVLIMVGQGLPWYLGAILVEPALWLGGCFVFCLVCHYQLQEDRPQEAGQLTTFYLVLSAGGFLGGMLVNWIVPVLFNVTLETLAAFVLGLWGMALGTPKKKLWNVPTVIATFLALGGAVAWAVLSVQWGKDMGINVALVNSLLILSAMYVLGKDTRRFALVLTLLLILIPITDQWLLRSKTVYKERNFYGVYTVYDGEGFRRFKHGTTLHGAQFLDPARKKESLTYYHLESPMGKLLTERPFPVSKLGLVGLGIGSLAHYAGPGDRFDFYELDPEVGHIAKTYFSYIDDSQGQVNLIYGDARVSLRNKPKDEYEGIVVDVFNSGSIPVHLITVEAFQEYLRVLKPGGVLLLHVSNQFLNLIPVVYANAKELDLKFALKYTAVNRPPEQEPTIWIALTKNDQIHLALTQQLHWKEGTPEPSEPWTDRYSALWPVLIR